MRDDRYSRYYDDDEPVGRHEAPPRREQTRNGYTYGDVYKDDWHQEPRQRSGRAENYGVDPASRRQGAQPRQRPQTQGGEPWRDRAVREQAVRQVEVQPPDYRRRSGGRRGQNALLIGLIVVLAGGMLFAGGKLLSIFMNYQRDRSAYNDLAERVITGLSDSGEQVGTESTPAPEEEQAAPAKAPYSVDWDSLRATNSDVVAWLICPDTAINYPVVQTADNDFYLHRGFADKQPNNSGTLFADKDAALGITYSNFIIYGHNMKDGSMFATVEDYIDPNFYEQHPIMYLLTPNGDYTVELIAGHIVESTVNNYPGYFSNASEYSSYLNLITSQSSFYSHFSVSTDYQLITLSTCNYSSNYVDPRYLLHGLMVPIR